MGVQSVTKYRGEARLAAAVVHVAAFGLLALASACASYDEVLLRGPTLAGPACGDGQVGSRELCDTGIAAGRPGACPRKCEKSSDPCAPILRVGQACQVQCVAIRMEACPSVACTGLECGADAGSESDAGVDSDTEPRDPLRPVHRYDFAGDGTRVRDRAGHADGTAVNAELDGDGQLQLGRQRVAFVEFPAGLVSAHESVTLEFWMTWEGDVRRRYERLFDLGDNDGSLEPSDGDSSFFLSPNYDFGTTARLQFHTASSEPTRVVASRRFPAGVPAHVVVVLDGEARALTLYLDARLAGSAPLSQKLRDFQDTHFWIGRSQGTRDPGLSATLDEFRIYEHALSDVQIERSFERGPDL